MPPKRVLILGHDERVKNVLHDLLEEVWVDMDAVINGEAQSLAEKVLAQRPDLVIADVYLGRSSVEIETIRRLKGTAETSQTPILALAEPSEGMGEARRAGADRVLAKPFDLDELARVVKEYIG